MTMDKFKDHKNSHGNVSLSNSFKRDNGSLQMKRKRFYRPKPFMKLKEPEMVPPDGGWGWMIMVGGFLTMIVGCFPMFGFSILFSPLLKSNVSSSKIAWIISIHGLVWNFAALLVGPLSTEFGWRKLAIAGGILNFLSVFLSVFITNPSFLFFSYSLLGGLGGSTGLSLSFIVVSRYFFKRRGFALAFTSLGVCSGAFLSPIVANYLLQIYGYKGAALIYGSLVLNQCVGGALFQPVEWHLKPAEVDPESENRFSEEVLLRSTPEPDDIKCHDKEKIFSPVLPINKSRSISLQCNRRLSAFSLYSTVSLGTSVMDFETIETLSINQDEQEPRSKNICVILKRIVMSTYESLSTLKFFRVKIICIGAGCLSLGYINFQMWIPFVIRNAGYSLEKSAWCASASSIANIVGRLTISFLSDHKKFNIKYGYMFSMFLLGLSIIAFSLVKDITLFLTCVCFWGLGIGIAYSLNATVFIATMGVENFPAVFGVSSLFIGIFSVVFGPVVGIIRDATSSYTYALWLLGLAEWIGFGAWFFMPFAVRYDEKIKLKEKLEEVQEIL